MIYEYNPKKEEKKTKKNDIFNHISYYNLNK